MSSKIENIFELNSIQKGILYTNLMDENSKAYYEMFKFIITGNFDIALFEESFNQIIERHGAFRTIFKYKTTKEPIQVILSSRKLKIKYWDIVNESQEQQGNFIKNYIEIEGNKPYDFEKNMLMRIAVFKLDNEKYQIVMNFHHIILDGWGIGILMNEWFEIYYSLYKGTKPQLLDKPRNEAYYQWLKEQDADLSLEYWEDYLHGYESDSSICSFQSTAIYEPKVYKYCINKNIYARVLEIAKECHTTINTLFNVVWGKILSYYTSTDDIVFGSVVSGRPSELQEIENMIGVFINTIPTRIKFGHQSFKELLRKCQEDKNNSLRHSYSSLSQIQSKVGINKALIDHIIIFENYPIEDSIASTQLTTELGLMISDIEIVEQTNYDLNLVVVPSDDLNIDVKYNGKVFAETFICTLIDSINVIFKQIIDTPDILLENISVLSPEKRDELVHRDDEIHVDLDENMTLDKCFEMMVEKYPDNTAIKCHDNLITYEKLNQQANKIAIEIRKRGISEGENVAVLMERGINLYASILGLLKAGCVYVPLNSDYPDARIQYILNDCSAQIIIVDDLLENRVGNDILKINSDKMANLPVIEDNTTNRRGKSDVCYIIYTSGSTGESKGVLVQHQNIIRICKDTNYIEISPSDTVLQLLNYSFDGSIFDIFGSLLNGAKLVTLTNEQGLSSQLVSEIIEQEHVTIALLTTALFNVFVDTSLELLSGVKKVLFGGEKVSASHVRKAFKSLGKDRMLHLYGPTETGVLATYYSINSILDSQITIPIGKAVKNTRLYILNKKNELLPNGAPGELCIGGNSVSLGYLGREELTCEKFINNPWVSGEKIYKTGDLVYRNEDNNIIFLDRIDKQVKIRGFRIELGEIENEILKNQEIKETYVEAIEDSNGNSVGLCSYYVSDSEISSDSIRKKLAEAIPVYMIPNYFIRIEKIPLTPNQKIDVNKLPKIEEWNTNRLLGKPCIEAETEYEIKITKIWEDVLGNIGISIDDNFMEIGGHSLTAMNVVSRINKIFGKDISIRDFIELGTIRKIAMHVQKTDSSLSQILEKAEEKDLYPLSASQMRMYAIWENNNNNIAYNMPSAFFIDDEVDLTIFKTVLNMIVKRHSALRTIFPVVDGQIYQKVLPEMTIETSYIDKRDSYQTVEEVVLEAIKPFDLAKGPLVRTNVIYMRSGQTILFIDIHHIISDGITISVIVNEMIKGFNGEPLKEVNYQYLDYSEYENSEKFTEEIAKQGEFWKNQFKGELPVLNLPLDFRRGQDKLFRGEKLKIELDYETSSAIKNYVRTTKSTSYIYFLSCLSLYLHKMTNQSDIIIGSPVSGRSKGELNNVVGMFVNTIAVRNIIDPQLSIHHYFEQNKQLIIDILDNQEFPFDHLLSQISYNKEKNRNPLFDVMFAMQNIDINEFDIAGKKLNVIKFDDGIEKFDITMQAFESETFYLEVSFNSSLWKKSTMMSFVDNLKSLFRYICENMDTKISDLSIISDKQVLMLQKEEMLLQQDYSNENTLVSYFEETVKEYPNKVAIRYNDINITYLKLNQRANQLAWELRKQGAKKGDCIAILLEKGIDIYIAIFAVLKIGCIYVPINEDYPDERIKFILDDCDVKMIIVSELFNDKLSFFDKTIVLDTIDLSDNDMLNPFNNNTANDICYIIYTSGSTGQAKGTLVQHKSVLRVVKDMNFITISSEDCILQLSSYAFDGSVFDIFGALLNGAELVAVDKATLLSAEKIGEIIQEKNVTISFMTTALFNVLIDINVLSLKNLKKLLFGGERVSISHVKKAFDCIGSGKLIHVYGPTETAVFASYYDINEVYDNQVTIPIGRAVTNTKLLVLDELMNKVPIGAEGELYIGGSAVSLGYLNQDRLTTETFIDIDFNGITEKYYKTGDLVRRNGDGDIEFLDRIDNQVKVRGFRIELGEIEQELIHCKDISEACVVLTKDNNGNATGLCAYYIVNNSAFIDKEKIRDHLSRVLPQYMIPGFLIQIDEFPMNMNGKIDTKMLPKPSGNDSADQIYVGPQTEVQSVITNVWESILGLEKISIYDNFFSIGGDSIKGIQIISSLKQKGINLDIKHLLNNATISQISEFVERNNIIISQEEVTGNVDILPIQRYFLSHQKGANINQFCQSVTLYKKGRFCTKIVTEALKKVITHHDALRMMYQKTDGNFIQQIRPAFYNDVEVKEISITGLKKEEGDAYVNYSAHILQEKVSLEKGELIKVLIIHDSGGSHLYMLIHHFVVDGLSWRYIIEDFLNTYKSLEKGTLYDLPPKTNSVQDFGIALREYASNLKSDELSYWQHVHDSIPRNNNTPTEYMNQCQLITMELEEKTTAILLTDANKALGTEINELLIAAVATSLAKLFCQSEIAINLEGHGREKIAETIDITRTVGWFTSIYPIIIDNSVEKSGNIVNYITEIRDMLRSVPNKGIGFGILKYMNNEVELGNKNPEVCFNYLGDIDNVLKYDDISLSPIEVKGDISDDIYSMYNLDISCIIKNHKLTFNVAYTSQLSDQSVQSFLCELKHAIKDITIACVQLSTETQISMSDVDAIQKAPFSLLLNEKKEKNVFVFPPHMPKIVYSIVYKNLSMYINDYSFYMFNFLETDKIIDFYVDKVIEIQNNGPYVLMGYSFGGALAFEVANRLISKGYVVSDVILIDSYVVEDDSFSDIDLELVRGNVKKSLSTQYSNVITDQNFIDEIADSFINYYECTKDFVNSKIALTTNIHLIRGDGVVPNIRDTRNIWKSLTTHRYLEYEGVGEHNMMLSGNNLNHNGSIIEMILNQIEK